MKNPQIAELKKLKQAFIKGEDFETASELTKIETPTDIHVYFEDDFYITDLSFSNKIQNIMNGALNSISDEKTQYEIECRIMNLIKEYKCWGKVYKGAKPLTDIPYVHLPKTPHYEQY